jgi:hypothetical protein
MKKEINIVILFLLIAMNRQTWHYFFRNRSMDVIPYESLLHAIIVIFIHFVNKSHLSANASYSNQIILIKPDFLYDTYSEKNMNNSINKTIVINF